MILRFYCDDGSKFDTRVASILEKYGFKGIFYIAPFYIKFPIMTVGEIKELSKKHEIGGHTLTHPSLTSINSKDQMIEILEGKNELEYIIGKKITKFAFPKGHFNDEVKMNVEKCGFKEARTMKMDVTDIDKYDKFEIPITIHFYPNRWEKWKDLYLKAKKENGYFGVTVHGWELEKFDLWEEYEKMLKFISKNL